MRIADLEGKRIVIWGKGREGLAAGDYVRKYIPEADIVFIDEVENKNIQPVLDNADVIIKSPGVSLYHPLLKGKKNITSLMNLWFAQKPHAKTICITGTKGKSTTTALLGHVLSKLGHRASIVGNIGTPISEASDDAEFVIIETSSYQAANFDGVCDIAAVTSLYPEHLDWHGSLERYYEDKLRLLNQARVMVADKQVAGAYKLPDKCIVCEDLQTDIPNSYLSRTHNRSNVAIVLKIIQCLELDQRHALAAMKDFKGLPHRQQELGEKSGVLYVDDSIATTPQAAMAAMDVYRHKPLTVILGGYDRGIDYTSLIDYIRLHKVPTVIGLGPSGERILKNISGQIAASMQEAVTLARQATPQGGVILLSPAAPSFGLFKDYIERGRAFAQESGF